MRTHVAGQTHSLHFNCISSIRTASAALDAYNDAVSIEKSTNPPLAPPLEKSVRRLTFCKSPSSPTFESWSIHFTVYSVEYLTTQSDAINVFTDFRPQTSYYFKVML